ncbi:MAG TPA: hypothetical protein VKF36_05435 [Syntrophorhabdales bacterium]|nr:hypothetical protein [Syntrophorhabdales bacterium]
MKPLVVCVALAFLLFGTGLVYGMGGGGGGGDGRIGYVQTSSGNGNANDGTHAQVATGGSTACSWDPPGTDPVTLYEPGILVLLGSGLIGVLGLRRTFTK